MSAVVSATRRQASSRTHSLEMSAVSGGGRVASCCCACELCGRACCLLFFSRTFPTSAHPEGPAHREWSVQAPPGARRSVGSRSVWFGLGRRARKSAGLCCSWGGSYFLVWGCGSGRARCGEWGMGKRERGEQNSKNTQAAEKHTVNGPG